jgi:hypothetical protein
MAAVDIILVRGVNDRAAVARYGDVFHLEFAGSQQRGCATGSGNGVKMVPPVLLGSEDDAVPHEMEGFVLGEIREGTHESFGAAPDRARLTGCSIAKINGPGIGPSL